MPIQIPASSILIEACRIFKAAKSLGIETPKLFSREFKYDLYSKYRDVLDDNGIEASVLGDILGNNARWDSVLSRFFVLNFLDFFCNRISTPHQPRLMIAYAANTKDIKLTWYKASEYSPTFSQTGPTLSIGDPRVMTIKMKVQYPNVSKGQNEYMFKWVNMRYDLTHLGTIKLQKLPRFKATRKPSGRGLTTEGMIKGLSGTICKFSYGELAVLLKKIVSFSLKILANETTTLDAAELMSVHLVLDVTNLICATSEKFEIVTAQSVVQLGPLFATVAPTTVTSFKINDAEVAGLENKFFVVFGSLKYLESILNHRVESFRAFRAEQFQLGDVNLYGEMDENEPIFALVFNTQYPNTVGDTEHAIFDASNEINDYEILTEDEILENFL